MAAEIKNFNQKGTVSKIFVKTGDKNGKKWRLTSFGIKYTYNKKTTLLYVNSFNMKEGLPLEDGDIVSIKGGIFYNNSYKKGDQYVNNYIVDANYANIINETKQIVLQEETEPKVKESTSYRSSDDDTSDVPF